MKVIVPERNYSITGLYDMVATIMGYRDVSTLHYDCREINVASNIQEGFFDYYKEQNPELSETELKMGVSMILLNYGPKTNEALKDYEVEVLDGFIC